MTDRLASCRDSPSGKHDRMAYTINGKTACRYCGREGKVSALLPEVAWVGQSDEMIDLIDGTATQV